jgi:hypothetical protein
MALKLDYTTDSGIAVKDAYCRIDEVFILKKSKMDLMVNYYANATAASPFYRERVDASFDLFSKSNAIAQGYQTLKTLPQFAGASDC